MLQLFEVEIRDSVLVVAESAEAARRIAQSHHREIMLDDKAEFDARSLRRMPEGWDANCLPYAGREHSERTVGEWIAAGAAPEWVEVTK